MHDIGGRQFNKRVQTAAKLLWVSNSI